MEGYLINNGSSAQFIFKKAFHVGHKMGLEYIWSILGSRVQKELEKIIVSEEEFVQWLEDSGFMREGFIYHKGNKINFGEGEIIEATSASVAGAGAYINGRLVKPSLANAPPRVLEKLTYKEVADLRLLDEPKKVLGHITNLNTLRRAYTYARKRAGKEHLVKAIKDRIDEVQTAGG